MSLNRISNHTTLIIQTKQVHDFIQASIVHSETLFNTVVATLTARVSQIWSRVSCLALPLAATQNLQRRALEDSQSHWRLTIATGNKQL
jgi:hypothetical protein